MSATDQASLSAALAAYHVESTRRRAGALIPGPDYVLGLPVRPLTAPSYTRLAAIGSPFLTGETAHAGDVRNYLWFHSRLFTTITPLARPLRWLVLLRFNAQLHRRGRKDPLFTAGVLALARADIRAGIEAAFADAPAGDDRGDPVGATLEVQLIHHLGRDPRWPAARVRRTPLRILFQYLRCLHPGPDRGELAVKHAHLTARNAALAAQRAALTPLASSL